MRARLGALNAVDISIDRSVGALLADMEGVDRAHATCIKDEWLRVTSAVPVEQRRKAMRNLLVDARDTCTAESIVRFVATIARGQALTPANTDLLLDTMTRCRTGKKRLKGLLPAGTRVAHKTGSLTSSLDVRDDRPFLTADVGLVDLPDQRAFVCAAFIAGSPHQSQIQDRIVARLALATYDEFLAEPRQDHSDRG